jgi:ribosomal protein L11 methyltransferase
VCLAQGPLARPFRGKFDLVVANILTQVILELVEDIPRVLKPTGTFICSGIIEENRGLVLSRLTSVGFEILEARGREGWVAIAAKQVHGSTPNREPGTVNR